MKRALIVSGGYAPHQPEACGDILRGMLEAEGMAVQHRLSLDVYEDEDLAGYDLIVPNWTVGEISVPTAKRLWAAVAGGVGLGGFHGGMIDAFRNSDRFRFMAGGSYVAEPGAICDYRVMMADDGGPITAGIGDFAYRSEQYYMHIDPAVTVLAKTRFTASPFEWLEGVEMPVVWTKRFGAGRVFVSALGHGPEEFSHPQMRTLLLRGLLWACR